MQKSKTPKKKISIKTFQFARLIIGIVLIIFLVWRIVQVQTELNFGPDIWTRFVISGLIIGSVYAVIAIGYTLVYGILFMINFAHGEVMMLGAFGGFFIFEFLKRWIIDPVENLSALNAYPIPSIILAFLVGMTISMISGTALEKLAYRPLRKAPRLVPLISAIGASIFLQNSAQLIFGPARRTYTNPEFLLRNTGWTLFINGKNVILTYTGVFTFVLSILLMLGLAENKQTAALMGIDVDNIISKTFAISGALAGAAGVMWGLHNGIIYHYIGFIPGIKAFTAAVLGGIGNIPGAMVGGLVLGIVEALGPAALGIDYQLKDVIAFSILVLVLIFRPTGILGEILSEEKV
jgi:branched-chain amino acid transport system permease protein